MKKLYFLITLIIFIFAGTSVYANRQKTVQPKAEAKKISKKEAFKDFDKRLVRIFKKKRARVVTVYSIVIGAPFSMTSATCVIGRLPNGNFLWLISEVRDMITVRIIQAIGYIEKAEWKEAIKAAKKYGASLPSPAFFVPYDYVSIARKNKLHYRGSYFKK